MLQKEDFKMCNVHYSARLLKYFLLPAYFSSLTIHILRLNKRRFILNINKKNQFYDAKIES